MQEAAVLRKTPKLVVAAAAAAVVVVVAAEEEEEEALAMTALCLVQACTHRYTPPYHRYVEQHRDRIYEDDIPSRVCTDPAHCLT